MIIVEIKKFTQIDPDFYLRWRHNVFWKSSTFMPTIDFRMPKIPLSSKFQEFAMKNAELRKFTQINPNFGPWWRHNDQNLQVSLTFMSTIVFSVPKYLCYEIFITFRWKIRGWESLEEIYPNLPKSIINDALASKSSRQWDPFFEFSNLF